MPSSDVSDSNVSQRISPSNPSVLFVELLHLPSQLQYPLIALGHTLLPLHHQLVQPGNDLRNLVSVFRNNITKRVSELHQVHMDELEGSTQNGVPSLIVIPEIIVMKNEVVHPRDAEAEEGDAKQD